MAINYTLPTFQTAQDAQVPTGVIQTPTTPTNVYSTPTVDQIAAFGAQFDAAGPSMTPEMQKVMDSNAKYEELLGIQNQAAKEQAQQFASLGGDAAKAKLASITAQYNAADIQNQAEQQAYLQQTRNVGGYTQTAQTGGMEDINRANAVKKLNLAAEAAILTGNIDQAKTFSEQAIKAKYGDVQTIIDQNKALYERNKDMLSSAEQKAAAKKNYILAQQQKELDRKIADEKAISDIGMTLRKYGASDSVIKDVLSSKNVDEAIIRAGNNLVDPKAKLELEGLRAEIALKNAQARKADREARLSTEPTEKEKKEKAQEIASAQNSRAAAQAKIDGVDAILNLGTGIAARVGPSALSRGILGPTVGGAAAGAGAGPLGVAAGAVAGGATGAISAFSGSGQQLAGAVHQLTSGLTLQTLIDAKANGATFGALTAPELNILASAATKLNDWEIKNEKGEPTGYWNIDEASFKKELKTIQDLSRKALLKTQGSLIAPEESSELDAMFPEKQIPANDYYN